MMWKNFPLLCGFLLIAGISAFAQTAPSGDLSVSSADLLFEQLDDNGFHLYIRKKPGIGSVLLTESTKDPSGSADNYAYRALEWNPINGDETRLLNGVPLPAERKIYSLISSTPAPHSELGEAFHIFVPWTVSYGYENSRHGTVQMADGAYINIRTFSLPYADYRGAFADNPFVLQAVQRVPENREEFRGEAEESYSEIAREGKGDFVYASSPPELVELIEELLKKEAGRNVDIVLCLDTSGSMGPYIDGVRKMLIPMMREIIGEFSGFRIGMVLFRDYPPDIYMTKTVPFTKDFALFQRHLNAVLVWGGGDIPEAVYEALYEGADKFPWAAESRLLILAGDAPPHPEPRGKITGEMVYQKAAEKNLKVSAILLAR